MPSDVQPCAPEERALLIAEATAVCGEFVLRGDLAAGSVGAALRTAQGRIYTGICIDLSSGLGFCAEVSAIAEMLKHRETQIVAIVAVAKDAAGAVHVLPPCGRCRETLAVVDERNFACRVILGPDRDVPLRDLLPEHWLDPRVWQS